MQAVVTSEFISSLSWCSAKSVLAAGTNLGNVIMWKHSSVTDTKEVGPDTEESWSQEPPSQVGMAVKHLSWGSNYNLLVVNTVREVFILREHQISAHFNDNVTAIQTSPTKISVYLDSEKLDTSNVSLLVSDIQVSCHLS